MWRSDFTEGNFPITRRNPIIAYIKENDAKVAYNRFQLRSILQSNKVHCLFGVWPGKKNTDLFVLDPTKYKDIPTPPEKHQEIDSSPEVVVKLDKDGFVRGIAYHNQQTDEHVLTQEAQIYDYVKSVGIKHRIIYASE